MKASWRWIIAVMLCVVIGFSGLYPSTAVGDWVAKIVYSTHDFSAVRKLLHPEEPVKLFVFDDGLRDITRYEKLTVQNDGFLLQYNSPFTIYAPANGVVIYSAHSIREGKTLIIAYDNGYTASYRFIDELHKLPYTTVSAGEQLGTITGGQLFLAVFKDGNLLTESQLVQWLNYAS